MLRGIVAMAVGCLVADLVIWGLTWASPGFTMPSWIFAPFFVFAIVANGVTIVIFVLAHGTKSRPSISLRHLPRWLIAVLTLVVVGFVVTGPAELFTAVPGQPGYNSSTHQYYYDNHGSIILTTRGPYFSAVATQTRGFLSFAIAFTCVALVLATAELSRRSKLKAPRLSEVPEPTAPPPRLCPPSWVGAIVVVAALVLTVVTFVQISTRVDAYASNPSAVTTSGITKHLTNGPWVVFTWCETHATDAPYGCPSMAPSDIEIRGADGSEVRTSPDPSNDHISPDGLPAAGQLTFSIEESGDYRLVLTRPVPKGVFVAESPGTVARSLVGSIVLAVLGIAVALCGVILVARRIRWRLRDAPPVLVETA